MLLAFDGICVLCNGFVRFLLKRDKQQRLLFTTNLSETGAALFAKTGQDPSAPVSVIFDDGKKTYYESDAALLAIAALGGGWRLVQAFRIVPPILRNSVYRLIARNRYRWFGRLDQCPLPPPEWRDRFIA
jgi:predicted DCC family thiol-disulfide oxidoreductase YuxK